MKLIEKLSNLESEIRKFKTVINEYPDAELVEFAGKEYFCSRQITKKSTNLEFNSKKHNSSETHVACIYETIKGSDIRVYSSPLRVKLFFILQGSIMCYDYVDEYEKHKVQESIIRQSHSYVAKFITENSYQFDKSTLPKNLHKLLSFI